MLKRLVVVGIVVIPVTLAAQPAAEKKTDQSRKEKQMEQSGQPYAIIETSMGTIEAELFEKAVPKTVKNFVGLAEKQYYDSVTFHRVIDNFMIQGGDPTGTGRGGESFYGAPFEDEIVDTLKHTAPGILSMANAGPGTNRSQFFITLIPTPWLDGRHTVFGRVVNGMDVLKAIGKVKTTKPSDKPIETVFMKKVTIVRR
jgi:peptidyl-prolyl cis-trans isomerase-like 1